MKDKSDIGLVGLAVMGENLILNMESKGFTVTAYNRSYSKVEHFLNGRAQGKNIRGASSIQAFVESLSVPRKVMLMVKAGQAVDDFIEQLIPHLTAGDVIIDGGNTHFPDSNRRTQYLKTKNLLYIGAGVSGGEEGALKGPSIMPGGAKEAWPIVKDIFQAVSAKVADSHGNEVMPCCDWVGDEGAGHFVKMVHNGIEYGDMQLICEAYQLMKVVLGMNADEIQQVFAHWNTTELDSYLIDITKDIFAFKDENGEALVEKILDTAGQKGTGKWTGVTALDLGVPLTLIADSVFARCISSKKEQRIAASKLISGPTITFNGDKAEFIEQLRQAVLAAKIVSYAQGYMLMQEAAKEFSWQLNYGAIALMWRGGCIIRSAFLGKIKEAYDEQPELENLLLTPYFMDTVTNSQAAWRQVVGTAVANGIAIPCLSSALTYFDGFRTARLPANLLQAQRDFFGAHTYERVDKPRGEFFHTNWTGRGGDTASTTYDV
ncbi:decarboxylating NADP(+)-dependent phosphogluconate dehydrogenase [Thalassotalea sp. PLHSN55]|uniref:decarboxylating NADP(+)-dependent phosphogluconate dehydrogenase n=1 Tax=Thalassotalea sp. PLHSN55 TaxID=3435888 RepID=UPI003F82A76F